MKEYKLLMDKIRDKENFALVRLNDGEMMAINKVGCRIARKTQVVSRSLHDSLIEVIEHRQNNYWIGKPCSVCFPKLRKLYDKYVDDSYEYQTHAVVFCNNGHWKKFIKDFSECVAGRNIWFVSGADHNLNALNKINLNISHHIKVPKKNSWAHHDKIKGMSDSFNEDDLIILSCGPLGRVLAYEWFKLRPDCTILDLGSIFDPYTRKVKYKCHKGRLPYCPECNFSKGE